MIDVRANGSGVRLKVHVQPRARHSRIDGAFGDALKVRVTAPPTDGKANAEVIDLLSDLFGVTRAAIAIVAGHTSRQKIVAIDGLTIAEARRALPP
jgi:uncharacterized protein (TIGR00251 family)